MSKAFLRAYMSDQLRDMDPLEKAVLIPNLIVGNSHGAAEFAFNPHHLENSEEVLIVSNLLQHVPICRVHKIDADCFGAVRYLPALILGVEDAYTGEFLTLSTIHPSKLYAEYQKNKKEGE
jgi:hypothetical protein